MALTQTQANSCFIHASCVKTETMPLVTCTGASCTLPPAIVHRGLERARRHPPPFPSRHQPLRYASLLAPKRMKTGSVEIAAVPHSLGVPFISS